MFYTYHSNILVIYFACFSFRTDSKLLFIYYIVSNFLEAGNTKLKWFCFFLINRAHCIIFL